MKPGAAKHVHCAIYTRVSTDQGLEQDFNSLDAQYDACQAYIRSQPHAGWTLVRVKYDDGGFSGGNTDRPALQRLLEDVRAGKVQVIIVYKVDRLTRSLADSPNSSTSLTLIMCRSSPSPSSSTPRPPWGG
jgi:site-specific DNA recombinase